MKKSVVVRGAVESIRSSYKKWSAELSDVTGIECYLTALDESARELAEMEATGLGDPNLQGQAAAKALRLAKAVAERRLPGENEDARERFANEVRVAAEQGIDQLGPE